jgi:centrosomal protein CEP104
MDTKGWFSEKFCDFPQELTLRFDGEVAIDAVQILGHEYRIPTRLEIYVQRPQLDRSGRLLSPDEDVSPVLQKLGYISMDKNDASHHKARELKTVHLQSERAVALKLVLQKCHINALNLYNQVGLVGVSVFGTVLTPFANAPKLQSVTMNESMDLSQMRPPSHPGSTRGASAPAGIPFHEDMSSEAQFDRSTLEKIRELTYLKEKAVAQEDYDAAARMKAAIDRLKTVGSRLAELEVKKNQAVASEDYDLAKQIKAEIDELRRAGDEPAERPKRKVVRQQSSGAMPSQAPVDTAPAAEPASKSSLFGNGNAASNPFSAPSADEGELKSSTAMSPSPTHKTAQPQRPMFAHASDHDEKPVSGLPPSSFEQEMSIDDVPVGASNAAFGGGAAAKNKDKAKKVADTARDGPTTVPLSKILEELPEWEQAIVHKMREFQSDLPTAEEADPKDNVYPAVKGTLGAYVSRCLLSPSAWQLRESALRAVEANLDQIPGAMSSKMRALEKVCYKLMSDKMAQVTLASVHLMSNAFAQMGPDMDPSDLSSTLSSYLAYCTEKLGDSNTRIRDTCSTSLLDLVAVPTIGPKPILNALIYPTFSPTNKQPKAVQSNWRYVAQRLNVIANIFTNFRAQIEELGPAAASKEVVTLVFKEVLNHANAQVRSAGIQVLSEVYRLFGPKAMEGHLEKLRPAQVDEIKKAFAEIDAAEGTREFPDDMPTAPKSATKAPPKERAVARVTAAPEHDADVIDVGDEDEDWKMPPDDPQTCQFCGRHEPTWNEEQMDMHFWQDCPLLTVCQSCGQVVELAAMTDHVLGECELKDDFAQCRKCHAAVLVTQLASHQKNCSWPDASSACPLCHKAVPEGDWGWQKHYLTKGGCPQNPRKPPPRKARSALAPRKPSKALQPEPTQSKPKSAGNVRTSGSKPAGIKMYERT